ncbi:amidohydrolase family protein [Maribacter sp. 2210JD10-5]|uniref:amidohydrolase family protein n=1 Tax=Maribacter sp. 2210JD10-5 TaxID=3386272 RepID=UPI0039BC6DFF
MFVPIKKYFLSAIMLTATLLVSCSTDEPLSGTIIKNVTVIDAQNGSRKAQTVQIKGNIISKVFSAQEAVVISKEAQIIDGTGKFLIPGLWDTHVHLTYNRDLAPAMFDLFLVHGITSIRDTGGELHLTVPLKKAADKDPKNTPRVKITGPLLDGQPTVYTGNGSFPKLGVTVANYKTAKNQVSRLHEAGVDVLKLYEMLSPDVFMHIMKMADSLQIPVTGHVPLSLDALDVAEAGIRSMEHLRNLELAFSKNWDSLLQVRRALLQEGRNESGFKLRTQIHDAQRNYALNNEDAERKALVLKKLADNHVWQVPTLTIMTVASSRFFGSEEWRTSFELLPDSVFTGWNVRLSRYLKSPKSEAFDTYAKWMFKMIMTLKAADVKMMAGTDAPIFFLTPGHSLHKELELLVQGGLTPLEALDAATLQPAKYFKMENELGRIEEGMMADLVLLNANPLKNIKNTKEIEAVIRDGKLHDKNDLNRLRQKLKTAN